MGKMTGYVYKFAIALNRTKYYFDKLLDDTLTDTYFINIFDMNNSLILAEYYINNSIKILNKVINPSDKIFNSEIEKEIYKNLPETFQSSNFIGEYKRNNISIATAKRRLTNYQNSKIVGKNRQGEYYKIIAA